MNNPIQPTRADLHSHWQVIRNRSSGYFARPSIFVGVVITCLALSPLARSQTCEQGCDTFANTFLGSDALLNNTTGSKNVAIGYLALDKNTTGLENTAVGDTALFNNTTGNFNTACGAGALIADDTGSSNSGFGQGALFGIVTGNNNTGVGYGVLSQSDADNNTATGALALELNTSGTNNTADGYEALLNNTTGSNNIANGVNALLSNTTGSFNAVNGVGALKASTTGNNNTADGYRALFNNTIGSNNIAIGSSAGSNLTTGSNNIDIGGLGAAGEANTIRLGKKGAQTNTYIIGVSGVTVASGVDVIVDTNGHMGTIVSSKRFKENIQPMDKASEAILSLKPVTFRYKKDLDPKAIPQFGLVAEEVEKVNPDLVARDEDGKPYSVRYEAVNAMLLNEFVKAHRKLEEQGETITRQEAEIQMLAAQLKEINARAEMTTPSAEAIEE